MPQRRSGSPGRESKPRAASSHAVALIGSSGGSTLRGEVRTDFGALIKQLSAVGGKRCHLGWMIYVEARTPLDHASTDAEVTLWQLHKNAPLATACGALSKIAQLATAADEELAQCIASGTVSALVLQSADVQACNVASVRAAIKHGVPVLGTGGTGMGLAAEMGATVLQLSGSVSTTADGRALAQAAALARYLRASFTPVLPPPELQPLPVLDAALPVAVAVALLSRALVTLRALVAANVFQSRLALAQLEDSVGVSILPLALATIGGSRAAALGESGVLAGLVAGGLTVGARAADFTAGPVAPAALVAGYAAGLGSRHLLATAHARGLPATSTAHLVSGGAGLAGGAVGIALATPLGASGHAIRTALAWPATLPPPLAAIAGALMGAATLGGSIHGYYHCVMLPLILLEMAEGSLALLGALDAACLCATCAGVMVAVGRRRAPTAAARGYVAYQINLLFGDYVEACYPYMEKSGAINALTYAGAAAAGASIVALGPARSSAYLPLPLAVAVAEQPMAMLCACILAFCVPCIGIMLLDVVRMP